MSARLQRYGLSAVAALVALVALGHAAEAQNLRVMPVPWVATDPAIPHQAYNGHATTFKAIARGGDGTYVVDWDFEGDGVYDFTATRTNRYDLSTTFTYPDQTATTTFMASVRVTSNTQTVIGTYPVRVFADVPTDPALATERQMQVMRSVAVDDALWFLHNQMIRTGNEESATAGAQIAGYVNAGQRTASTAGYLWALSLNGHYAAFPSAYIGELPDPADNDARWANDPYAEDAARIVNQLLTQATVVTVTAADEVNTTGFYPEVQNEPIYGTDDGFGLYVGYSVGDLTIYPMGHVLSAFSVANLDGFVAQVGDANRVLGRRMEHVLQQMVDGVVWSQSDSGTGPGSWHYQPNQASDDLSTTLWGMTALWHADEFARDQGVIVPNLVKTRLASYILSNSFACPQGGTGGSYANSYNACDTVTTAGHLLGLGWVGANQWDTTDTRLAFPSHNGLTRGQLRAQYDSTLTFIGSAIGTSSNASSIGWNQGIVENGDYTRADGHGNHYGMLHWQDAARAVEPEVTTFGTHDWARDFSTYLIKNQATNGSWNWVYTSPALNQNSDNDGGVWLRAVWAILVLSPDAIPPLAIAEANATTAPEGTAIDFDGNESDPGTGNPEYAWDFDNGDTATGITATYAYPDDGTYDVTLTSTSVGGTSTDTIQVTITNVAPTATAGSDLAINEGSSAQLGVSVTDPGTADVHTYAWDLGDTGTATAQNPSHVYVDNGVYTAVVTVDDGDGGTDTDDQVVTVSNVAPTITSTPAGTATEGTEYTYTLTFTDPGALDTHTCSLTEAPTGMTLTGCDVSWTPSFDEAVSANTPVTACVTDNDGGETCQSFNIAVTFEDTDGDGLPDSWEMDNFGDLDEDQFGDPDGDGMNNLQEFNNTTDPNVYDGPSAPVAQAPACGSEISSLQTMLTVTNAVDPQGAALTYDFQIFSDVGLTILVSEDANVPEGADGTTSWAVPVNLVENTTYYWRVRTRDSFTNGAYSAVCSFLVNSVNETPGVPRINAPAFGSQVNSLTPALVVDNATDPDLDTLTYEFEVYGDQALSTHIAAVTGVVSGATTSTWTVDLDLAEDTTYYWRARATDDGGLSGDWSSVGQFFVTTVNAPPEIPVMMTPQNGTVVADVRPELMILNADDADFDVLVYDWELATDDTFANVVDSADDASAQGAQNTAFALAADLTEDTRYCWRVRSDDGAATSAYATACFFVSTTNDAPSVPTLQNPSADSSVTTVSPVFSWAPSTDPEGEALVYDVEILDAAGDLVTSIEGVTGTTTAMAEQLEDGETYTWHARSRDNGGVASEFSAENQFVVDLPDAPVDEPEVVVNGGGCSTTGGSGAGGLLLVGLGLMVARRRRRG